MKNLLKKAAITIYTSQLLTGLAFAANGNASGSGQNGGTNGAGSANGSNGLGNVSCPGNSCGSNGHGVPEITAVEGAAALAVVIATLLLLRELWQRQKKAHA